MDRWVTFLYASFKISNYKRLQITVSTGPCYWK
jgi:hypothetical protein